MSSNNNRLATDFYDKCICYICFELFEALRDLRAHLEHKHRLITLKRTCAPCKILLPHWHSFYNHLMTEHSIDLLFDTTPYAIEVFLSPNNPFVLQIEFSSDSFKVKLCHPMITRPPPLVSHQPCVL